MWETGPLTQPEMYLWPVTELVRTSERPLCLPRLRTA